MLSQFVVHFPCNVLALFLTNRLATGGELSQHLVGLTQAVLCFLAFRQIEHERDTLVSARLERGDADQHGDAAAVFAEVLLFERFQAPSHFVLWYPLTQVTGEPFRWREVHPA